MVLTDRQRQDLHAGIYEYLLSREGFGECAEAFAKADPKCGEKNEPAFEICWHCGEDPQLG